MFKKIISRIKNWKAGFHSAWFFQEAFVARPFLRILFLNGTEIEYAPSCERFYSLERKGEWKWQDWLNWEASILDNRFPLSSIQEISELKWEVKRENVELDKHGLFKYSGYNTPVVYNTLSH